MVIKAEGELCPNAPHRDPSSAVWPPTRHLDPGSAFILDLFLNKRLPTCHGPMQEASYLTVSQMMFPCLACKPSVGQVQSGGGYIGLIT